jgi:hypothetical protein
MVFVYYKKNELNPKRVIFCIFFGYFGIKEMTSANNSRMPTLESWVVQNDMIQMSVSR